MYHIMTMHVIIPMSGIGKRFIDENYKDPKPLIEVDGFPMIQHVVNLFPNCDKLTFICNNDHMKSSDSNIKQILENISNCKNVTMHTIDHEKLGPVNAVSKIFDFIEDNEEVIISYCDYGTKWNYNDFLEKVSNENIDGAIACYIGFHPHILGKDNYAFVKHENMMMQEIREKQPFTDNKMNEYASNGTYYFKKGEYVKKYFKQLMDLNINVSGEFYVSMVYNLMKHDDKNILIYEIDNMLQWGTPYDLKCYNMWSDYFRSAIKPLIPKTYDTITILPMAGKGSRFSMVGYELPKPLLPVNNNPMVIEAVNCLPQSKSTIFVGLEEHYNTYPIEENIRKHINNVHIKLIKDTTDGQATTCIIPIKNWNIDSNQPILISACDNGVYYDVEKYDVLMKDTSIDVIVWSFNNHPTSTLYPYMYAWLDVDENNNIKQVSVKKPFADKPNKYCISASDKYCIIGTMFFRKSKYFVEGYDFIVKNHIKTNNEYYVDNLLNYLIDSKLNVKIFNVDYYLCWGTPNDYKTFNYWQDFFDQCWWHPYQKQQVTYMHAFHRINNICDLNNVPKFCGVEIDLRDSNGQIIVTHDPFSKGILFEEYIKHYKHSFIILNIKSEGIEFPIIELLKKYNIVNYFFLDSSFPMINKLSKSGEQNIAVRLSEYEDIQTVLNLCGKVKWVWVDCFTKFVLTKEIFNLLKSHKFNICLVSPELHNNNRINEITNYKQYLIDNNIIVDVVCTKGKNIKLW